MTNEMKYQSTLWPCSVILSHLVAAGCISNGCLINVSLRTSHIRKSSASSLSCRNRHDTPCRRWWVWSTKHDVRYTYNISLYLVNTR